MGKQSDSRLINYSMWVLPNFRYPVLVALQIGLAIPTLFVRRSHKSHLFISSPDIIEMRSVDALFFIDRRSHWNVDAIAAGFLSIGDRIGMWMRSPLTFLLIGDRASLQNGIIITYHTESLSRASLIIV